MVETNLLQKAKDLESDVFKDLYSRMDKDRDLVNLSKYEMTDLNNKAIKDVINVTLNKPAVFAANVETALSSSSEQVYVDTEDEKLDTDEIADFVRSGFRAADLRQSIRGKFPLNPFFDQQMCRRGRGAARVLWRIEDVVEEGQKKTQIVPDITPWDSRYLSYEMGEEGLSFASYHTVRRADAIKAQYPEAKVKKSGDVFDIWTPETNEIYVEGNKVYDQANPYGYVPVCVQVVTLGSMLADKDNMEYEGESIFFLIRDLIPEFNRVISILASLNFKTLKAHMIEKRSDTNAEPSDYDEVTSSGGTSVYGTDEGIAPLNLGDVKNSTIYLLNEMNKAIQQGSLEILDVGSLPGPLSAVALIELAEGQDQIFLPRLGARGLLNTQIAEMFIRQTIASGINKVELGVPGHKREFDVAKLKGDYEIGFNYFIKSPKVDVARYSMAQNALAFGIDRLTVYKDILQSEDPEGMLRRYYWDMAEKISPSVLQTRTIKALSELADDGDDEAGFEAEIMSEEMGLDLEKIIAGEYQKREQPQLQTKETQNLLPLLSEGGQTSAKKAAQLQAEPKGSEVSGE
jgi:hypothetical protein